MTGVGFYTGTVGDPTKSGGTPTLPPLSSWGQWGQPYDVTTCTLYTGPWPTHTGPHNHHRRAQSIKPPNASVPMCQHAPCADRVTPMTRANGACLSQVPILVLKERKQGSHPWGHIHVVTPMRSHQYQTRSHVATRSKPQEGAAGVNSLVTGSETIAAVTTQCKGLHKQLLQVSTAWSQAQGGSQ